MPKLIVDAQRASDGAGVTLHRAIGIAALRHLDPFLMLDYFGSDNPHEYIAGFPDHPHRGFITLTYMLDGRMEHRDSMGNRGELHSGGVQWMKAASGVIHAEMPRQDRGLMRGFQLWLNLPRSEKMSAPAYRDFQATEIPQVSSGGARVKVIAGRFGEVSGPVEDPFTQLHYLDVTLAPGATLPHVVADGSTAFAMAFEGELSIDGERLAARQLAVLVPGEPEIASAGGGRYLLVTGRPLGEPIVQYGPFVMSTQEEIATALEDYRQGRLVRERARSH